MARTKTTSRLPSTEPNQGKRRRCASSPSLERPKNNLFREPQRQKWYEYDIFLAEPLPKFDPEIVKEFYANAYSEDNPGEKRSKARGRWVNYD